MRALGIHRVAQTGDIGGLCAYLARDGDPSAVDPNGFTPLHSIAISSPYKGDVVCARLLLDCGVDVNALSHSKNTPLYFTTPHQGNTELVQLLINHGAMINYRNPLGETILYAAVWNNNIEVVELLLRHGADPMPGGVPEGRLPMVAAICNRYRLCLELLLDWGAKVPIEWCRYHSWEQSIVRKRQLCKSVARMIYVIYKRRFKVNRDIARALARTVWDTRFHKAWMREKKK